MSTASAPIITYSNGISRTLWQRDGALNVRAHAVRICPQRAPRSPRPDAAVSGQVYAPLRRSASPTIVRGGATLTSSR